MNIIIVEDEPHIREGVSRIIESQTDHKICATFERGEEGLAAILRDPPDLVITDIRMGDLDGLTMLAQAREAGVVSEFIILTGYSSFEYARIAIHLRVADYLLKPIMVDELLESLEKIEKSKGHHAHPINLESMFEEQLAGKRADTEQLGELLRTRYEVNGDAQHMMVLFQLGSVDSESFRWASRRLKENSSMLCIENVVVVEFFSQKSIVLLLLQSERNIQLERALEEYVLQDILSEVRCICVAHRFYGLEYLAEKLKLCRERCPYALVIQEGNIITEERVRQLPNRRMEYPADLEQKMKSALFADDGERVRQLSAQLIGETCSGEYSPKSMTEVLACFLCTICVAAEEKDPRLKGNFSYNRLIGDLKEIESPQKLAVYFENVLERMRGKYGESDVENLAVARVIGYIQKHYMEEIMLSTLAAYMNLTPEYLSSLFRKEMGINFSSFLKNFRISYAKRLLETDSGRIQDISQQVGFNDPKYFNRVFKEICGLSPSEYRANQHCSGDD